MLAGRTESERGKGNIKTLLLSLNDAFRRERLLSSAVQA